MRLRYFFDYGGCYLWAGDDEAREKYGYDADLELMPLSKETHDLAAEAYDMFLQTRTLNEKHNKKSEKILLKLSEKLYQRIVTELSSEIEVVNESHGAS